MEENINKKLSMAVNMARSPNSVGGNNLAMKGDAIMGIICAIILPEKSVKKFFENGDLFKLILITSINPPIIII